MININIHTYRIGEILYIYAFIVCIKNRYPGTVLLRNLSCNTENIITFVLCLTYYLPIAFLTTVKCCFVLFVAFVS